MVLLNPGIYTCIYLFQYPWDVIKEAWNLGLVNTHIPVSCGNVLISYMYLPLTLVLFNKFLPLALVLLT